MSCILRVYGTDLDVEHLLLESGLRPYKVYRRGEQTYLHTTGHHNAGSGFNLAVSEAEFHNPEQQVADALAFLEGHEPALTLLASFPGVENAVLDFGIEDRDVAAQVDSFPPRLLLLMGQFNLGLDISRYPRSPQDEEAVGQG